jgi:membrane fusion protein (multidrug efflux system)
MKVQQINKAIEFGKSFGEPKETVELAIAELADWQPMITVTADVMAIKNIDLVNEAGGRVVEIGFKPGAQVKKGQVLIRLDTREEQAQLAGAQADADLAKLALERNKKLAKTGVASQEARDQARAQSNAAIAAKERLQAVIDKKTLRAPFDGVTGLYLLEVGQYLQANTLVTRLVGDTEEVWIDFYLPQQQATLKVGDSITLAAPQLLGEPIQASIIARDSWVNPRSGNLRYRALANSHSGKLYPGSVVTVTAPVGESKQVVRVPISSVRYDAFGASVYILNPSEEGAAAANRAEKRTVKPGLESEGTVIIIEGVSVGERIAGNGAFKLRSGVLVNTVSADGSGNQEHGKPELAETMEATAMGEG